MTPPITEKTRISLPIQLTASLITMFVLGAIWLTTLSIQLDTVEERSINNERINVETSKEIKQIAIRQYIYCLMMIQVQKYTVPKHAQQNADCRAIL